MTRMTQGPAVPPKLPPHVRKVKNRLGREYYYLHLRRGTERAAKPIRLPDDPRSPEFWNAYADALGVPPEPQKSDTFAALIKAWQSSPEWKQYADKTREEWSRYCKRIEASWGALEVKGIQPKNVLTLRNLYAETPASANNLLRCLSSMLSWSVPHGWRNDNPCDKVKKLKGGEGYPPWPWEIIQQAVGELREDLAWAVHLALYTGQRKGDCLAMRWDHIRDGLIWVTQDKTDKRLAIPLHRDLKAVLERIPKRAVTILTSTDQTPWTVSGFNSTWQKNVPACAGGLVFHGLRKSAVVMLLEAGCSDAEVSSITGQSRAMVEHYAKQVNQLKLARSAILKLEAYNP